jgi:SAM-dependent methyltransferase
MAVVALPCGSSKGIPMPDLDTSVHLDMLRAYKERNSFVRRVRRAVRDVLRPEPLYGLEWGDPEATPALRFVRENYVLPYVNAARIAVEIGPGGGRWTRYLLGFRHLYVVDFYPELLQELRRNFNKPNMTFIRNHGSDFPGVPEGSVDFVFSFDCFVHLDAPLIEAYLKNIRQILMPGGNVVIHYSDKTKAMARLNPAFSENTPERMRQMVLDAGFRILAEDLTTTPNSSSIIRFAR